ncbi:LuxR family transcriptional regulator [Amycolatopsis sp. WAC 01416]|uniref:helix-turn-helix transcriptional regulator n=1 Tax=Amycolatopsis sp. WAC 01416 TaxID=2203196 RepID=UPI000F7AA2F3|nr:helix-turn-helix transcriptional regulator [Amycolatopsis sp. WAC 01416]RSN23622.1 LuxR family transcriptional regulator [Amycolatopsis sp. WAC 01416]
MNTVHYGLDRSRPVPPGGRATRADMTLSTAIREVLVLVAMAGPQPMLHTEDLDNLRRGVRYRVLVPIEARNLPEAAMRLDMFASRGAEIRAVPSVPMTAMVVDGTLALLPGGRCGELTEFRAPSVVMVVAELFERLWRPSGTPRGASTPRTPDPSYAGSGPTRRELDLLTLLMNGYTDESAAARLGISERTVRRMVADLMSRLSARSRFQAGAKAADRGWLIELAG